MENITSTRPSSDREKSDVKTSNSHKSLKRERTTSKHNDDDLSKKTKPGPSDGLDSETKPSKMKHKESTSRESPSSKNALGSRVGHVETALSAQLLQDKLEQDLNALRANTDVVKPITTAASGQISGLSSLMTPLLPSSLYDGAGKPDQTDGDPLTPSTLINTPTPPSTDEGDPANSSGTTEKDASLTNTQHHTSFTTSYMRAPMNEEGSSETKNYNKLSSLRRAPTSMYRGVSFKVKDHRFVAQIRSGGKQHYLGLYETEEEAAAAYDQAALSLHRHCARLNFPPYGQIPPGIVSRPRPPKVKRVRPSRKKSKPMMTTIRALDQTHTRIPQLFQQQSDGSVQPIRISISQTNSGVQTVSQPSETTALQQPQNIHTIQLPTATGQSQQLAENYLVPQFSLLQGHSISQPPVAPSTVTYGNGNYVTQAYVATSNNQTWPGQALQPKPATSHHSTTSAPGPTQHTTTTAYIQQPQGAHVTMGSDMYPSQQSEHSQPQYAIPVVHAPPALPAWTNQTPVVAPATSATQNYVQPSYNQPLMVFYPNQDDSQRQQQQQHRWA